MASVLPPCVSSISSSPGEWDCPSIELSRTTWDASDASRPVTVQGTVHLDTRFFRRPLLDTTAPFAITVALTAPGTGSLRPLDWNQEDAERTGLAKSATSNPRSNIVLHERTRVDRHLCRLTFTIAVPPALFLLPTSPTTRAQSSLRPSSSEETHIIHEREFGVAVKAFDITGRVTQTNVVQFLIRARVSRPPSPSAPTSLSPSSARSAVASTNTSSRRSSVSSSTRSDRRRLSRNLEMTLSRVFSVKTTGWSVRQRRRSSHSSHSTHSIILGRRGSVTYAS